MRVCFVIFAVGCPVSRSTRWISWKITVSQLEYVGKNSGTINAELKAYNADIASRPQVIAANKVDVIYPDGEDPIQRLKDEFELQGVKVFPISAVTGKGVKELLYHVKSLLDSIEKKQIVFEQEFFPEDVLIAENLPYTVEKLSDPHRSKRIPGELGHV